MNSKSRTKSEGPVVTIVVAVVIALLAGGSSPWWWDKLFPKPDSAAAQNGTKGNAAAPECSPEALKSQLHRAGPDKPAVIKSSARTMKDRFSRQDFDCVSGLAAVLLEEDQDNGHGLYYMGETWRVRAKQDPKRADLARERMREFFFRYLASEPRLARGERDGDGEACYQRERGYCAERTAWINHLMAADYYQQAQDASDAQTKVHQLQRALAFVENDLKFGGFDQVIPSPILRGRIQAELQSLNHRSSGAR